MRLIDADALISFIDPEHLRHSGEVAFSEIDVINMLNHAPTAYDVDRVMEQLEVYREELEQFGCSGILTDMNEVLKDGGVDGKERI